MGDRRRGLAVGFVVLALLAALVGALAEGKPRAIELRADDVVVDTAPGAQVPRLDVELSEGRPVCTAVGLTGGASLSYRLRPDGEWEDVKLALCRPTGFSPGAVGVLLRGPGLDLEAVIPVNGWRPNQKWLGADAQIGLVLQDGTAWRAWDAALPCRIRTSRLRRFFAPAASFQGEPTEPNAKVLVGAWVEASFECSGLPRMGGRGPAVDLRGELAVQNCEGAAAVVPPPQIPPDCRGA